MSDKVTVCGVASLGEGKHKSCENGEVKREYRLWNNMIDRCYNSKRQEKQHTYIGCSVTERWLNYQNFCEDIKFLSGYSDWIDNKKGYQLDKDTKIKGNKIYSLKTCLFTTTKNNIGTSSLTGLSYRGTRIKDGYIEDFNNQTDFADKYILTQQRVSACLAGFYRKHRGWTFKILTESNL